MLFFSFFFLVSHFFFEENVDSILRPFFLFFLCYFLFLTRHFFSPPFFPRLLLVDDDHQLLVRQSNQTWSISRGGLDSKLDSAQSKSNAPLHPFSFHISFFFKSRPDNCVDIDPLYKYKQLAIQPIIIRIPPCLSPTIRLPVTIKGDATRRRVCVDPLCLSICFHNLISF